MSMLLALLLTLLLGPPANYNLYAPTATLTYAMRQVKTDTIIVFTYPAPGTALRACSVWYTGSDDREGDSRVEVDRHCWTPTNDVSDIDVWPNTRYDAPGRSVTGSVTMRMPDGRTVTIYTHPIYGDS